MGDFSSHLAEFGIWYIVFLFSTVAHEAAHGLAAHLGGDPTAYEGGQVTLDPIGHIKRSPFGMVLIPIMSFFQTGWMMGWASVPFDPSWGKRHPRRQALMSLAGPAANFALALIGIIALKVLLAAQVFELPYQFTFTQLVRQAGEPQPGSLLNGLAMALSVLVNLNVLLGCFNLIPIPPLDGAGVFEGLFPKTLGTLFDRMREIPILQFVGLLVAWNIFPAVTVLSFALYLVHSG
ncbi:MAG TPA: site-2 protease family protein [Polyangiaceae bacterium]|nr:site-2 protease family protein [Polyangiaceae bacterium]